MENDLTSRLVYKFIMLVKKQNIIFKAQKPIWRKCSSLSNPSTRFIKSVQMIFPKCITFRKGLLRLFLHSLNTQTMMISAIMIRSWIKINKRRNTLFTQTWVCDILFFQFPYFSPFQNHNLQPLMNFANLVFLALFLVVLLGKTMGEN